MGSIQIFPPGPPGFQVEFVPKSHQPNQIIVEITRVNRISIDGIPTSLDHVYADMAAAVSAHRTREETLHIVLRADKDSTWDATIKVRDAAWELVMDKTLESLCVLFGVPQEHSSA